MTQTIKQLLAERAGHLHALGADHSVTEAVALMNRQNVGAVLVLDPDQALLGIFTERDVLRRVLEPHLDPDQTSLEQVMTRRVVWVAPDDWVDSALAMVSQHNIRHLPVMEGSRVLGMISVRDLTAAVVAAREIELADLTRYVHGRYGG